MKQLKQIGSLEQIQHRLAGIRAKLKPSQKECGPDRRETDLTDGKQIQGDRVDTSHRCAHPLLQEPQLSDLIDFLQADQLLLSTPECLRVHDQSRSYFGPHAIGVVF